MLESTKNTLFVKQFGGKFNSCSVIMGGILPTSRIPRGWKYQITFHVGGSFLNSDDCEKQERDENKIRSL